MTSDAPNEETSEIIWHADDYQGLADLMDAMTRQSPTGLTTDSAEWVALRQAAETHNIAPFDDLVGRRSAEVAEQGGSLGTILRQFTRSSMVAVDAISAEFATDLQRLVRAMGTYIKLKDMLAVRAGEFFAARGVEELRQEQRKVIRELSTPAVQVWEGILVMPLIGIVDSARARQMMEMLLERISALSSRVVILDVTGVPTVDTDVANHLVRMMRAARLLGARTILVGISPAMAQALVRLEITFSELETYADLRSGLEAAFERLGLRVQPREGRPS